MKKILPFLSIISLITFSGFAQEAASVKTEVLSKTTTSWDGSSLPGYPEGQPEITISKITIPPGVQLPMHKHPNPLGGIVMEGSLVVTREDGTEKVFNAGEAVVELVNKWHYGRNDTSEPVVLIAFYVGVEGEPLTILKEN